MFGNSGAIVFAALMAAAVITPAAARDDDPNAYKDFHERPIYLPRDSHYWDHYVERKDRPRTFQPTVQIIIVNVFPPGVRERLGPSARQRHQQSFEQAMANPSGQTVTWTDMGGFGSVTVTGPVPDAGRTCRTITQRVSANGADDTASSAACLTTDGRWQLSQ
jgi:surface antigen